MEYKLINGNSLEVLKTLEDNSIDSIVTDPPYELGFMGKSWDKTGIAYNEELWAECYRVLKPGGHLIAFSGSRTYHRMACAIENVNFEIRDQIMWIYGSGFPKSLDIGKAIDKKFGAEREVIGISKNDRPNSQVKNGRGFDSELNNGQEHKEINITEPSTEEAKKWDGYGTALKPAHEPMVLARKPLSEKTVAENVLKWGTCAINIDESRIETTDNLNGGGYSKNYKTSSFLQNGGKLEYEQPIGRWPANLIHDGSDEVQSIFPDTKSVKRSEKNNKESPSDMLLYTPKNAIYNDKNTYDDSGNASRYFYCAKASKKDRNDGLNEEQKNHHPTVKPTDLMQYLVKLITPIGGTVLDPFNGSGSTGKACAILKDRNYKYIGIDLSQEYLDISKARIENELNKK